jgi:hypothetical protein
MNIQIIDSTNTGTVIGAGANARGMKIVSANQIVGWVASSQVQQGGGSIVTPPFGSSGGDCLFDTGSLFCFDGTQNSDSDNVLMVLWRFPVHPKSGTTGGGQLNAPPASGMIAGGDIRWRIV